MEDAAMLAHATGHKEGLLEFAQAACARETYLAHIFQVQFWVDAYLGPIFGIALLGLELVDVVWGE
jgi:hypothetical protein